MKENNWIEDEQLKDNTFDQISFNVLLDILSTIEVAVKVHNIRNCDVWE